MWKSPTGHNDVLGNWTNEANGYDGDKATYAVNSGGGFLELTLTEAISCDKIRYFIMAALVDVDVYYDDDWHDVFEGDAVEQQWVEKTIPGGPKTITKARIAITGSPTQDRLYEFEFNIYEITPAGDRGKAMVNLRQLVAESSTFQTAVGVTGADADTKINQAILRIHITAYEPDDADFERPFALICKTENDKDEAIGTGVFSIGGDLELRFEDVIAAAYQDDPKNAELNFLNFVETVLAEMKTLSANAGYFAVNDFTCIEGPTQFPVEGGDFVNGIRLLVNWGLSA